ncbi:MAG TPA: ATP phosphoribosyltransferase regulatory subunit, partial [Petrotogaceae bacterium]|nr:ATP phosphoribosyltransferase regulatory subunit [Petrotogaceae bacterium]
MNGTVLKRKDFLYVSEKYAFITSVIRDVLHSNGFHEIFPSSVHKCSSSVCDGLKFSDGKNFYVINPDITSCLINSITESTAKIFYIAEKLDSYMNSSWQIGFEIISPQESSNITDTLKTAITIMEKLGKTRFFIDLGSLKIWEDLCAGIKNLRKEVFEAVKSQNFSPIFEMNIPEKIKKNILETLKLRTQKPAIPSIWELMKEIDDERVWFDASFINQK